ncbi:MAG: cupin domain-containing protein [Pseudomonadota bacterium]
MLSLSDLLHPITPEQFDAGFKGRKPLHIPAGEGADKRALLTWDAFNGLLDQSGMWNSERLQLMNAGVSIPPEQYCKLKPTPEGRAWRPSPAKVEFFLSAGASIVANDIMALHPPVTRAGVALGEAFAAEVGASIFCSFKGVRSLATHYDLHEIFAVQTEGEKIWNLYEGRADSPIDYPPGATQADIDRTKGRLLTTVHMKPGDVLYLPRGVYHDAVAVDQPSLHVTYTVMPLTGRILLSLLDKPAMQNAAFRAWLPAAAPDHGAGLQARLAELGAILAEIAASPAFRDEVIMVQRRLMPRAPGFGLPELKPLTLFHTTGRAFPEAGTAVRMLQDWMLGQRRFALEDMIANFDILSEAEVREALAAAEAAGAVERG